MQVLEDYKETRRYWRLKEEALDHILLENSLRKMI